MNVIRLIKLDKMAKHISSHGFLCSAFSEVSNQVINHFTLHCFSSFCFKKCIFWSPPLKVMGIEREEKVTAEFLLRSFVEGEGGGICTESTFERGTKVVCFPMSVRSSRDISKQLLPCFLPTHCINISWGQINNQ